MYCSQCGNQLNTNGICDRCSNNSIVSKLVKVVVTRASAFVGCAVNYKVYVDGNEVGQLSNGGSLELMLSPGQHNFAFDMWSASNAESVMVPDNCSVFYIDTKLSMGLITNNIKIVSLRSE